MRYRKSLRYNTLIPARGYYQVKNVVTGKKELKNLGPDTCIENLGAEGVYLVSDTLIPVGTLLRLNFYLPNSFKQIILLCHVLWKKEENQNIGIYGYGIRYQKISAESKEQIVKFLIQISQKMLGSSVKF
jgi:c-di-GMP-binding flagellar brake protein YcgR